MGMFKTLGNADPQRVPTLADAVADRPAWRGARSGRLQKVVEEDRMTAHLGIATQPARRENGPQIVDGDGKIVVDDNVVELRRAGDLDA